jgi:hypothetical protein
VASELRLSELSESRKRLVRLAHDLRFGRIEGLTVECGEPSLGPPCRVFATRRYGGQKTPRPPLAASTVLRAAWSEFFADLDEIGSGGIERLDIDAGLPVRASLEVRMPNPK